MSNKLPTAYKVIGEVSKVLNTPAHVLRFWERKFKQIAPYKHNNRRYYSAQDIDIIKNIKFLLYEKGFTINGVKTYLTEEMHKNPIIKASSVTDSALPDEDIVVLKNIMQTVKHIKAQLQDALEK